MSILLCKDCLFYNKIVTEIDYGVNELYPNCPKCKRRIFLAHDAIDADRILSTAEEWQELASVVNDHLEKNGSLAVVREIKVKCGGKIVVYERHADSNKRYCYQYFETKYFPSKISESFSSLGICMHDAERYVDKKTRR
jgi:hypothetical protein